MATINEYSVSDKPKLIATFTDADSAVNDPVAALIEVLNPDESKTVYLSSFGWSSQGNWDASANSPTLSNTTGTAGHYYAVTVAGTANFGNGAIRFEVGDTVYFNGSEWRQAGALSSDQLTKTSTGVYFVQHYLFAEGWYIYRSEGISTEQCAEEKRLRAVTRF